MFELEPENNIFLWDMVLNQESMGCRNGDAYCTP